MSNYSSCLFILTQLIGFEKSDNNGEKITLPDQVEIDTLIQFKSFVENSSDNVNDNNDTNNQSNVNDTSFWACSHCTYHNPIDINTCQMCNLPHNVCILCGTPTHELKAKKKHKSLLYCRSILWIVT